jgi:hypothetical protein
MNIYTFDELKKILSITDKIKDVKQYILNKGYLRIGMKKDIQNGIWYYYKYNESTK